ncbi:MAG: hypothetical protein L0I76_31790, partial [Pseudonocardia sp.]|nr:hypothetical protein [Pseudonocardia sp.]
MLEAAAALRWRRPRVTAELAHQVAEDAAAAGDGPLWLRAAGWYLHGRAATEDAREAAVEILTSSESLPGGAGLDDVDAARLRVELAVIAQGNGDVEEARSLVGGSGAIATLGIPDDLELDRVAVLVRCALAGAGSDLEQLRRSVDRIGGRLRAEPAALADLLAGAIHRSCDDQGAAAASALSGLANLGWTPDVPDAVPASPHLAAALFSQWITALLDGGSAGDVSSAVRAVRDQQDRVDDGRQGVLLRLTLARALPDTPGRTAAALRDVADRAARVGVPSLEAACRATQAEVHEGVGEYREALAALRAGTVAERADRDCGQRFRDALAAVGGARPGAVIEAGSVNPEPGYAIGGPGTGALADSPRTDLPRAEARRAEARRADTLVGGGRRPRHGTDRDVAPGPGTVDDDSPRSAESGESGAGESGAGESGADDMPGAAVPARRGHGAGTTPPTNGEETRAHLLEWAERTWYGPGRLEREDTTFDSGAPLADAMVEELRVAASRRAAPILGPANDVTGPHLAGDDLAGGSLAGDDLVGDDLARDSLLGDDPIGDSLAGDDLVGDSLLGDDPIGDSLAVGGELGGDSLAGGDLGGN